MELSDPWLPNANHPKRDEVTHHERAGAKSRESPIPMGHQPMVIRAGAGLCEGKVSIQPVLHQKEGACHRGWGEKTPLPHKGEDHSAGGDRER